MLKKFPSEKINGTNNTFFFLSRAQNHNSFTFNLRFLYELKHKIRLSKTVCGVFNFWFRLVFIEVYIIAQQNAWTLGLYNVIAPFKIKIIEKATNSFCSKTSDLKVTTKSFKSQRHPCELELPKTDLGTNFNLQNRSFESLSFSH